MLGLLMVDTIIQFEELDIIAMELLNMYLNLINACIVILVGVEFVMVTTQMEYSTQPFLIMK